LTLNFVSIKETFQDGSGNPLSGYVEFTVSQAVYASGIPVLTAGSPVTVQISGGQLGSVELLATDNSGLSYGTQTGWFCWTAQVTLSGQTLDPFSFFLPYDSLGAGPVDLYSLADTAAGGGGGAVDSVFGRTGAVVAASGDYTYSQVTGAASSASVTAETERAETAEALLAPVRPGMLSLAMTTLDLYACSGTLGPGAQALIGILTTAPRSVTIARLGCWVASGGVTPGTGVNGLAIYSEAGSLLNRTADMTAAFGTPGYAEGPLTGDVTLTAGANYYLCILHDFSGTSPSFAAGPGLGSYPQIRGHYPSVAAFGQPSFPASITPSAIAAGGTPFWLTAGE
jgi:hypothetical protein